MRSTHADLFNHDDDAAGYDVEVGDESDPLRAGYGALLDWIIEAAALRDEFFWYLDSAERELRKLGLATAHRRFSRYSFGLSASKS